MSTGLSTPTYHDLLGLLARQRQLIERLLFRHAEIAMLIAAGEHRFVGKAIDEALEVESELAAHELMRATMVAAVTGSGDELGTTWLIDTAPEEFRSALTDVTRDMKRLITQIDRYRQQAASWAGEKAGQLRQAIDRSGSSGYLDPRLGS